MKIAVLAGGLSPERDVSLSSGSLIANALIQNGHSVALVDLYIGIDVQDGFEKFFFSKKDNKTFSFTVPEREPDLDALKREVNNGNVLIGKNVLDICRYADIAFIALHGSIGENGQLQAAFDAFGIRYTGTGYIGSLLAMDKDIAKRLMVQSGINTPEWILFDAESGDLEQAYREIGLPCVVKPCSCGSSVGVSLIREKSELHKAVQAGKKHERFLIIEKMIEGREFSVGVLDGAALPAIEIIPNTGFYDYANKYQPGLTTEICPAELSESAALQLQNAALETHKALRLGFYSRIDFLLDENNRCYCLEANTLPGMTPTSLLPQEARAVGISYNDLCEKIAAAVL